jgi:hypothetical protein
MLLHARHFLPFTLIGFALMLSACLGSSATTPNPTASALETNVALTLTAELTSSPATEIPTNAPEPTSTTPARTSTSAQTDTPVPAPTETPIASPTALENNVFGKICFPGESIPEMNAFFEETNTGNLVELPIQPGQTDYKVKLEPGTYIAYAWLPDFSRGGLYSRAVPCGMGDTCDDHSLLPFMVNLGESLTGIDLCDWYAGPFNVPYPPGVDRSKLTGNISGSIKYPGDESPELRVVTFNVETNYFYWVNTQEGQTSYGINELPPGTYHVVAYEDNGNAGAYADANHNLLDVLVKPGETSGADITDWSAPPGTFPEDPTR